MTPEALDALVASGAAADMIAAAWKAEMIANDSRAQTRRDKDAERKRRERARPECHADIGGQAVTDRDISGPPSLDKESFPQTPFKEINPNPVGVTHALTRKAGGFGPPQAVALDLWNTFCRQRKKALTEVAYSRLCLKLDEAKDAGWPPGELVGTAVERGWETVFIPTEKRNGQRYTNHAPEPVNPMLEALRLRRTGGADRPSSTWSDGAIDHTG